MAWVRLDDQFPDHPKVVTAGPLAGWLHVCALAYCNRHLTDGFIPRAQVGRLANFDGMLVGYEGDDGDARTAHEPTAYEMARALVEVGIWVELQGGYQIHDFLDFQPSRAEIEARKKVRQDAGRLGGQRSGEARSRQSRSKTEANREPPTKQNGSKPPSKPEAPGQAEQEAKTNPVPDPDRDLDPSPNHLVGSASVGKSEKDQDQVKPPEPEAVAPLVDRMAGLWPGHQAKRAAARSVVLRCLAVADPAIVDEEVGKMLKVDDPPRSPKYLLASVRNRLLSSGAYSPNDERLAALAEQ